MFKNTPKSIQNAIAISIVVIVVALGSIACGFAWRSLSSEVLNLQVANNNLQVQASLSKGQPEVAKAKVATDVSKDLVVGIKESVAAERKQMTTELLTAIESVQGSYCANQLKPLTKKINAIEAKSVLPPETEKALETAGKNLQEASDSLEKIEQEVEQEIKENKKPEKTSETEEESN